ncbi:UvrD-helicase domain-containing protein [Butyrivibrio fibrisolvens]|uniref:UvrD-helicase domain-containing protein n=1 Tax=Butyrivibrio fibrisolvens TaxID=831 RepID=UPI000400E082|nr:UvrD-helicase domain-containing protein [Butyrivibrio fibrisolvens]
MGEAKVAIASSFLDAFVKLKNRQIQGKTTEFVNKFRNDPKAPGINYEKIHNAVDDKFCSVRIDDTYRGIVVREDDTYVLLWVDHHDEAYDWASRKRCEVNKLTGVLQIFDVQVSEDKTESTGIFSVIDDQSLLKLGVPESIIAYVKDIPSKEIFYQSKGTLPQDAFENLSWYLEGIPVNEIIDMVESNRDSAKTAETISEALEQPETLKSFVVVEGEEELKQIMAAPLEKWRVFLHPTQRRLVKKDFSGPARVLGGAGTGKTVVAMHRAKYLASLCEGRERILFTTYTANLAQDIKENLRKICSVDEMRHIEVINFDAWVKSFLNENGYTSDIKYGDDIKKLWDEAVQSADSSLDFDEDFYIEEWNRIVEAQETFTLPDYIRAPRNGRGTRLDRKKRIQIWKVFEAYMNLMKENQVHDMNYAMYECGKLVDKMTKDARYKHIIVDEGQDLSPNALRLMRTMMGEEHQNDIFIVGDAHQRIYENHATLSACGINIRGRSSILKINYRTTDEIREYAFALLNGISFDDLDDSTDDSGRCQSLTHGDKPEIHEFKDASEELAFIDCEIKKLKDSGVSLKDICITARTNTLVNSYQAELTNLGYRVFEIKRNKIDDRSQDGLRVATMHRVKGLEFQYVFVVAVNDRTVPLKSAIRHTDKVSEQESITSEKCLLYVALTRAQKGAYICSYGRKSEFLK